MEFFDIARAFAALVLVLGLFMVVAVAARRWLPQWQQRFSETPRRLEVIETRALDARHRLVLVRCDAEEHLLVIGSHGVTRLQKGHAEPQDSGNSRA